MTLTGSPAALVRSLKGAPLACLFILLLTQGACAPVSYARRPVTAPTASRLPCACWRSSS